MKAKLQFAVSVGRAYVVLGSEPDATAKTQNARQSGERFKS